MKRKTDAKDNEGLTDADIDKAIEILNRLSVAALETNKDESNPAKITDDGKHITFEREPDPNSPYQYIREGKPLKIKTVYHDVEVEFEDSFGGKLACTYSMRKTAAHLFDTYRKNFPLFSKSEIEAYAELKGKDFATSKIECALIIANIFIETRLKIAKFLHTELEPTLKMALKHLLDDAFIFGWSELSSMVDGTKQLEQSQKPYLDYRKERTQAVRKPGRQKGEKDEIYSQDGELLKRKVLSAMKELNVKGYGKKGRVAEQVFPSELSNPSQRLDRELEKHGLDYKEILKEFLKGF